eukprot:415128_1
MSTIVFQISLLLHYSESADSRADDNFQVLNSTEGQWGLWSNSVYCDEGQFAYTFNFKSESNQGTAVDDTAGNGVRLICKTPLSSTPYSYETSSEKQFGNWFPTSPQTCGTDEWLIGFRSRIEPDQGPPPFGDNVALSCIQMNCSHGTILTPNDCRIWGDWGEWNSCTNGFVCGFQEKYQLYQANDDDTALNAVRFHCCDYITDQPSISPSTNPSQYPTDSPTVNPTIYPSIFPTKYPTINPSITPISLPTKLPPNNPTKSPSFNPTVFPSKYPTVSPVMLRTSTTATTSVIGTTSLFHEYHLIFVCHYNDDNGEHYKSLIQLITAYASIMDTQILDAFQNIKDEDDGDISEFTMCTLFNDQKLTNICDSFELNDKLPVDDAEYVAIASFTIVHVENALNQFQQSIIMKMQSDEFKNIFTTKMNSALQDIKLDMRRRNLLQNNFEAVAVQIIDVLSNTSTSKDPISQQSDKSDVVLVISISVVVGFLLICILGIIIVVALIYYKKKQRLHKINDMEGGINQNVKHKNKYQHNNEGMNELFTGNDEIHNVELIKSVSNVAKDAKEINNIDDDDIIQEINETKIGSEENALMEAEMAKPMKQTAGYHEDFNEINGDEMLQNDVDIIHSINQTNIGEQNDQDIIETINETHDGYI